MELILNRGYMCDAVTGVILRDLDYPIKVTVVKQS